MNIPESKRNFYLKINNPKFIINAFRYGASGFLLFIGLLLSFLTHDTLLLFLTLPIILILGVLVPLFIKFIVKKTNEKVVLPEVSDEKISKNELFEKVKEIDNSQIPWDFEIHENEGWIDVTWKWKDYANFETGAVKKNKAVFYKFYKIHDDYTYEELDMLTNLVFGAGNKGFNLSYNMQLGHLQYMAYNIPLVSVDENGVEVLKENRINTIDLTNYMHKFFADNGYTFRKWY